MDKELQNAELSATEEQTSVAFSDWTQRLRFDRSFTAKLILSEERVKGYYAELATAWLRYGRVRSHMGWAGVSFSAGRERVAFIAITGKTLCLYLAADPEEISSGRYKARDVSGVKARSRTPSLLRIRSDGAKNHALRLIAALAAQLGLAEDGGERAVSVEAFRADSFHNLITRGLIRILKGSAGSASGAVAEPEAAEQLPPSRPELEARRREGIVADTVDTLECLLERHGTYNTLLTLLAEGEGSARLTQRSMLRAVDEIWVKAIEDCIPAIDELIRNPKHFIAESEEVLPIEKTKRISGRSIAHLCRHTDYINVKGDGELSPTKMLNVFREDSLLTYENKFLNTLINRLYSFVSRRYKVAKDYGADERLESFEFENRFTHGEGKGRIRISVEYSERELNAEMRSAVAGTGLWHRVERLNGIVTGYVNSSFAKTMERNFVHPPILRTNAILKNKYFRECLALWEFIESYNDAGYGITVEERSRELSDEYVRQVYAGAAIQYLLFRQSMDGEPLSEEEISAIRPELLPAQGIEPPYSEQLVEELADEPVEGELDLALEVALRADEQMQEAQGARAILSRTFPARLSMADDTLKENFAALETAFLAFDRVKLRHNRKYATVSRGRLLLARLTVNGGVIRLYCALSPGKAPAKLHATDVSDKATFAATPTMVRIRSRRGVKYAEELIGLLAAEHGLKPAKAPAVRSAADYPALSLEELLREGLVSYERAPGTADRERTRGIAFGSAPVKPVAAHAGEAERLAVSEASRPTEVLRPVDPKASGTSPDRAHAAMARQIEQLARPSTVYDRPTEYGIDDASGFMRDIEGEQDEKASEAAGADPMQRGAAGRRE